MNKDANFAIVFVETLAIIATGGFATTLEKTTPDYYPNPSMSYEYKHPTDVNISELIAENNNSINSIQKAHPTKTFVGSHNNERYL